MTLTPDHPEIHTVATIEGVGCTYRILTDEEWAIFDVTTTSGPKLDKPEATFTEFTAALRYIADQIDTDLAE